MNYRSIYSEPTLGNELLKVWKVESVFRHEGLKEYKISILKKFHLSFGERKLNLENTVLDEFIKRKYKVGGKRLVEYRGVLKKLGLTRKKVGGMLGESKEVAVE